MFRSRDIEIFVFLWNQQISKFVTSSQVLLHNASYTFFWILSPIKTKFGQILVCGMTNISNMFLAECGRRETSSRLFYEFIKITIQQDLVIFNGSYTIFNCPLFTSSKKWNTGILAYLVIELFGQVAKLKRTLNLAPVSQILQKITENYCPWLYLSADQVWWLHDVWFKRYIQKCTLSHVLILIVTSLIWKIMESLKIQKLEERNIIFLRNKKILNLRFRWHILRSYGFVAEVTFR